MRFMGSKAKLAKDIVPILQQIIDKKNIRIYIEPFVGGANIIDKIKCKNKFGYDRSDTLIALLQQASADFSKIPIKHNKELWEKGKAYVKDGIKPEDMTLAEIGAVEFLASFSNGGFPRGYAQSKTRDFYLESYEALKEQAPNLKDIQFKCQPYWRLPPVSRTLIYCDPPYQNAIAYEYASRPKMNYDHFWNWVRKMSEKNEVIVSENVAPDDFRIIWEKEYNKIVGQGREKTATEKLFKWKGNKR